VVNRLEVTRSAAPVREETARVIRQAIADGTLPPGSRLKERELVELTGVSRTSVREAVRILETQGLVYTVPGEGPRVATLSEEEARELYALRGLLESYAVRQFTLNATDENVAELGGFLSELAKAGKKSDDRTADQLVDRFYDLILTHSGNRFLRGMLEPLHARISMLRTLSLQDAGRKTASMVELAAIVSAVSKRDADGAQRLAAEHVAKAAQSALAIMAQSKPRRMSSAV
jgi:DNA-binding GntR family transcriptional regulator